MEIRFMGLLIRIGKKPEVKPPLTPEEREQILELRKQREKDFRAQMEKDGMDISLGKPSSKEGREIYYQRVGVWGLPFELVMNVWGWMTGDRVWYSDKGVRYTTKGISIDV